MEDQVLPATADALVDYLNEHFPELRVSPSMTERDIWFKAGQREVVNHLNELRQRRDETLTVTNVLLHS